MTRRKRILWWVAAAVVLLPPLAAVAVAATLNTDPGRGLAERLIEKVTGGSVRIQGLGGRFPDHLRLAHIEVHDANGAWLLADDVALDWHPTALIHKVADIDRLEAARLQVPRLPASVPAAPAQPTTANSQPFKLPVAVVAKQVHIARADIGASVLGEAGSFKLDGSANVPSLDAPEANLVLTPVAGPGRYALDAKVTPERIDAKLSVDEPAGGFIARLAKLPDIGALRVNAGVTGPRDALATKIKLEAGPLTADADGTVNLAGEAVDLRVNASAPAMRPAPDVSWDGIQLQARVQGPFTKPDASWAFAGERTRGGRR